MVFSSLLSDDLNLMADFPCSLRRKREKYRGDKRKISTILCFTHTTIDTIPALSYKGHRAARRRVRRGLCDRRQYIRRRLHFRRLLSLCARDRGFDGLLLPSSNKTISVTPAATPVACS